MVETKTSDLQLDVRGEICPYPMIKAEAAMKLARENQVIEVVTDHAPALSTIPTQAKRLGFAWKIEESGPAEWRIFLWRAQTK